MNKSMNTFLKPMLYLSFSFFIGYSINAQAFDWGDLKALAQGVKNIQGEVSTPEEVEMGGQLISGLLGAAPLVDNASLQQYVNDVGFWVASQSSRKNLPWRFAVIDSSGINAFAAPGGYVVITLGLFSLLENEAQLAGVLAHEVSHVVEKHHLNALKKSMNQDFWAKLGTKVLVKDSKDQASVNMLVNAGVQLYAKGLDREFEYAADSRGVVLAARAGYDPYALLDVLTTIDSINPGEAALTVMLNTHPPTGERLSSLAVKMDGKLEQYGSGQSNAKRFHKIVVNLNK